MTYNTNLISSLVKQKQGGKYIYIHIYAQHTDKTMLRVIISRISFIDIQSIKNVDQLSFHLRSRKSIVAHPPVKRFHTIKCIYLFVENCDPQNEMPCQNFAELEVETPNADLPSSTDCLGLRQQYDVLEVPTQRAQNHDCARLRRNRVLQAPGVEIFEMRAHINFVEFHRSSLVRTFWILFQPKNLFEFLLNLKK